MSKREVTETLQLESKKLLTPSGVKVEVTSAPHRDGNPDHLFHEVWFYWEGGTLRTSQCIHDEAARVAVSEFLEDLTGYDYYDDLSDLFDKYVWYHTTT